VSRTGVDGLRRVEPVCEAGHQVLQTAVGGGK
jgi:hypothetical protein